MALDDLYERRFYKAQPIVSSEPVMSEAIVFELEIPACETLADAAELYDEEGTLLERALFGVLPGGTYDALLRHMLKRRASLLVVPFTVHAPVVAAQET